MSVAIRCDLENKSWCVGMASRIQPVNDPSPGLSPVETVNVGSHSTAFYGVSFKADRKDKGILLNYCPWCGERLRPF